MYDGIFKILHIEWGCEYPLQSCIKYRFSTTISIMCRVIRAKKSPCEDWLLFLIGQKRCSSRLVILNCHPHILLQDVDLKLLSLIVKPGFSGYRIARKLYHYHFEQIRYLWIILYDTHYHPHEWPMIIMMLK
jgi:hypothetical protein